MSQLTENNIKKAALRFLKTYYKFRPRTGETNARYDVQSQGGIIADGHLSFRTEEGTDFIATFEATSFDTRDEVRYRIQSRLLIWDSLAIASILAAFAATYAYGYHRLWVKESGLWMSLILLNLVMAAGFLTYYFLFRGLHKYRYIYAIEQFKRYHANEQWIAIGEDVFHSSEDGFLRELKDQCVLNGFGLISIDLKREPHLLITPSRQEVFGDKRRLLTFVDQEGFKSSFAGKRIKGWWGRLKQKIKGSGRMAEQLSVLRYRRTYFQQMLICMIALGLISGIAVKEYRDRPFNYVDEQKYEKEWVEQKQKMFPETEKILLDSLLVDPFKNRPKEYERHVEIDEIEIPKEEEPLFDIEELVEVDASGESPSPAKAEIVVSLEDGSHIAYNCERFYNIRQKVYILQENSYTSLRQAQRRVDKLQKAEIMANLLWLGCFSKTKRDFVVYLDFMFESRAEAQKVAKNYEKQLQAKKLNKKNLLIRSISRVNQ